MNALNKSLKIKNYFYLLIIFTIILLVPFKLNAQITYPVPPEFRGSNVYERMGQHDANNIRTRFWNFGMVGDYPSDPLNVDLTVFHSMEWPKGSLENYSDGHTPYVLSRIIQTNGSEAYIMETGYRERQAFSPLHPLRIMRYEPRPGYFQQSTAINVNESPAVSNDSRTWPDQWIDKLGDPDDPGWSGSWNGYFGKAIVADQESFVVYDDNYYEAWNYNPDDRDPSRRGLGLRVEQRGFQWSNPQAGDVIFWHYDITNEGTKTYDNNVIFGIYLDSGVGGSAVGVDGIPESDDDNASYQKTVGLDVVYTWDVYGNGARGPTGYLGYAYLETPGNEFDAEDNDSDGILNESRAGGMGQLITGRDQILAYIQGNYNISLFEEYYGVSVDSRAAVVEEYWWTGDEDLDWLQEFHDTGADGVFGTNDNGENDGMPTPGEPNFDQTDIDESDQIGLTGFKMNRIRSLAGLPVDQVNFYMDINRWPEKLYQKFTSPNEPERFDDPVANNYNIGFLFASGPFRLLSERRERFSLAQGFGRNLRELETTLRIVNQIYKANYQFAVPPPLPTLQAYAGDGFVRLSWDDVAERGFDPVSLQNDFEGYRIYRSTDPAFLDPKQIINETSSTINGTPIAIFDLQNDVAGFSNLTVQGRAFFLGDDVGITHSYIDTTVTNGQIYYYAVTAYDRGADSLLIYPSENPISVSQTIRAGVVLTQNVVEVRPNPPVPGFVPAQTSGLIHSSGEGVGTVDVQIINSDLVPDNHDFKIIFLSHEDSIIAERYGMVNLTTNDTLFTGGRDFIGEGKGPVGLGILPVISTPSELQVDSASTGFTPESPTTANLKFIYDPSDGNLPKNRKRPGYPENIQIVFSDEIVDTSLRVSFINPGYPVKFKVYGVEEGGVDEYNFYFTNASGTGTLTNLQDAITIVTYTEDDPETPRRTWRVQLDTVGQYIRGPLIPPTEGDVYNFVLNIPFSSNDEFTFTTTGQTLNTELAKSQNESTKPYVVPNPYIAAASFEPQRFAVSGRGERRIEFRGLPVNATIRIFTVAGELVQTLFHNGNIMEGYVAWDLRSKDNLEVAPGLYIYHVEAPDTEDFIGKFAIIK
jgi:hypothetical protein